MIKKILVLLTLSTVQISAQSLDELYNNFLSIVSNFGVDNHQQFEGVKPKCSFGIRGQIKTRLNEFTIEQQTVLRKILSRPALQNSMVSPKGYFKIHYNTTGDSAVVYDLNELAVALDSSYNYEVNILGYPAPPTDNVVGGDNKYDVYIVSTSDYGYTETDQQIGPDRYTTFMVLDNDYTHTFTKGIDAAKVTVAHEFHHAIQLGNYKTDFSQVYFYEATSTAFEEFVYNSVNDYYQYLNNYFNVPSRFIADYDGYELCLWHFYLVNKFGQDIIKRVWELFKDRDPIPAYGAALVERGSTLKEEYNNFGLWTYFTNTRSLPGQYFDESSNYPLLTFSSNIDFSSSQDTSMQIFIKPVANYFFAINDVNALESNSIMEIITMADFTKAAQSGNSVTPVDITLSRSKLDKAVSFNEKYYIKTSVENKSYLFSSYLFNGLPFNPATSVQGDYFVFPLPFNYSQDDIIYIPINGIEESEVTLYVYSLDMQLVYSGTHTLFNNSKHISWNVKLLPQRLATGVYVYAINYSNNVKKGKLIIIND